MKNFPDYAFPQQNNSLAERAKGALIYKVAPIKPDSRHDFKLQRYKMLILNPEVASKYISWKPTGRIVKSIVFLASNFQFLFNLTLS